MERSGIYASIALDGAPVDPRISALLGLDGPNGAVARGIDRITPQCVDHVDDDGSNCILVGRIDGVAELAAGLGLAADSTPARLARAALDRFGDTMAAHVAGEWTFLAVDGQRGTMCLASSIGLRDQHYYRIDGRQVIIAPDFQLFRRIGGNDVDAEAMLFQLGTFRLRRDKRDRTILSGVHALQPGTVVTMTPDGARHIGALPVLRAIDWSGDIDQAIDEISALMRQSMRRRLAGHRRAMCLISGGLDSSTIAWLAAAERDAVGGLTLLSSVSAPGSGIADERDFSEIVARHLDLPVIWLTPDVDAPVYRPTAATMAMGDGPHMGPRHYLYTAFHEAAAADGSSLLLDGASGEMTVTGYYPIQGWPARIRAKTKALLGRGYREPVAHWPADAFHVQLPPHRLAQLPEAMRAIWAAPRSMTVERKSGDAWGFMPGSDKMMHQPAEAMAGRLRTDYPFRDLILLRRFAGFPVEYTDHPLLNRGFARRMMAGQLPDAIRLRPKGSAFSPDYYQRLQRQAAGERDRIALFRAAGADDWIDLDWLDGALARLATGGAEDVFDAMRVQITAMVAEYLLWWREGDAD